MGNYLVVGATSGVGRELAICLSQKGHYVVGTARRENVLLEVQKKMLNESLMIPADITKKEEIVRLFEKINQKNIKLDGMVYCAGICDHRTVRATELEDLQKMYAVNVFGYFECCKLFAKTKYSNKGSSIVGISSYAAVMKESGMVSYAMTKNAMNVQSEVMAKEFAKRRIRINTVMPAVIKSKMTGGENNWTEEEIKAIDNIQTFGVIPIENVVGTIEFLLSDTAEYITGQSIVINAGYHG